MHATYILSHIALLAVFKHLCELPCAFLLFPCVFPYFPFRRENPAHLLAFPVHQRVSAKCLLSHLLLFVSQHSHAPVCLFTFPALPIHHRVSTQRVLSHSLPFPRSTPMRRSPASCQSITHITSQLSRPRLNVLMIEVSLNSMCL